MRVFVSGGRAGAAQAADAGHVAIIVDALRASATTASLLHHGAREIIVVEDVQDAFALRAAHPGSWIAGERAGLAVPGFDMGNSPLQEPIPHLPPTLIFSSSNMSRCCVGAASCPAAFLGTLPTLTACAQVALQAAERLGRDIQLVPAGAAVDENKLVIEDYVAAGAIIGRIQELARGGAEAADDAARAALIIHAAACAQGYEQAFLESDNGRCLDGELGLGEDVRCAARVDVLTEVPQVVRTDELPSGRVAAVLRVAESAQGLR